MGEIVGEVGTKKLFENDRVVVWEMRLEPGETELIHEHKNDYLMVQIAGRESAPAESVWKNIKSMKGTPAGRLLNVMNFGYSRSLGVRCQHCHDGDKWDSEENSKKQVARDMMDLMRNINTQLLPQIKNLKSEHPGINCTTCHRGQRKPALNL